MPAIKKKKTFFFELELVIKNVRLLIAEVSPLITLANDPEILHE